MPHTKVERTGWKFYNTLEELDEWRIWVEDAAQKFHVELLAHGVATPADGVTQYQRDAATRVRESLTHVVTSLKKIDKDIQKIRGRRIRKPRVAQE